jgi:hypothetical protein
VQFDAARAVARAAADVRPGLSGASRVLSGPLGPTGRRCSSGPWGLAAAQRRVQRERFEPARAVLGGHRPHDRGDRHHEDQRAEAAGASTTRFYLSTNASFSPDDVPLTGYRLVPALAPGASVAGATSLVIPANVVPGSYFLLARADADGEVGESLETNNALFRFFSVVSQ